MLLTLDGHEVRTAYSVEFALAPGMDDYEVAQRTRAASSASMRLIAVNGYGQPEDEARCQVAGFNAHLVKPVLIVT